MHLLAMSLQQSIQNLVSVCEHPVGEQEGVGIVWVRGAGDELGEQGGDGQVL